MYVAHNILAMNAQRQYNISTSNKSKSTEKLSSGYRINRAADDAAGLSISEEMRRQIRGLDKGGSNIQEGISLCQIADGALGEVTSILQRVRQLSIQAYNGTNSKTDRACIQDEIDSCLDGINEIQERTKYNELYVLKDNVSNETEEVKKVWVDTSYTITVTDTLYEARKKPDWLQINDGQDENINHNYNSFTPDTSGVMAADYEYTDIDGHIQRVSLYYGDENATHPKNYKWIGDIIPDMQANDPDNYNQLMAKNPQLKQYVDNHFSNGVYTGWTADASDNVSCKIDFSGLVTNTSSVEDLYTNMFNLLGSELGFPCGTCDETNAIRFTGEVNGYTVSRFSPMGGYVSKDNISLSDYTFSCESYYKDDDGNLQKGNVTYKGGYFEAIECLHTIEDDNLRNAQAKELAQTIAEDLTKRMKNALLSSTKDHFDRVADDNDPTKNTVLYVYDYRDTDALTNQNAANAKLINSTSSIVSYYTHEETVQDGHYEEVKPLNEPILIQGSANVGDSIPIELRNISTKALGIDGYNINSYTTKKVYDAKYEADMAAYKKALDEMEYIPVTSTEKYLVMTKAPVYKVDMTYVNGEMKISKSLVSPSEYETREQTVTTYRPKYHLTEPQPRTKEEYAPSDLSIIDNAMTEVSKMRSYFGASQNRLEHAYAGNKNTQENTDAAESRIRDTDMAEEMVNYSKHNILEQVGQSMLAQANQSTQGVLTLLQ